MKNERKKTNKTTKQTNSEDVPYSSLCQFSWIESDKQWLAQVCDNKTQTAGLDQGVLSYIAKEGKIFKCLMK